MKKPVLYILFSFLIFSCKEEPKRTDYIINGTAKGVFNGVRVHLNTTDDRGRDQKVETKMVVNEQFTFEGKMDTPAQYNITVNSVPGKLPIMLENSEINVDINKAKIADSKITGSKSQKDLETYQKGLKDFEKEITSVKASMRHSSSPRDVATQNSLSAQLEAIENKKSQYALNYIKDHEDRYFSLFLIDEALKDPKLDIEKYVEAFNSLASTLKTSKAGVVTKLKLEKLYRAHTKTANLAIGKIAPNFSAPNPDGKMVALNDIKGKVTIIDFWAAWCGPCRRENPNVVKIYNEYHSQGLEIIGVSLDGSRRQKNPKEAWLDAVKKDQLTWTQVSYLKYFNDPVAELYNIQSIPATFILDKDGKIVAKNLRGNALKLKVQELLQK